MDEVLMHRWVSYMYNNRGGPMPDAFWAQFKAFCETHEHTEDMLPGSTAEQRLKWLRGESNEH